MRLNDEHESGNLEDRRGMSMLGGRAGGIGIGTNALSLVAMYFGVDPSVVLSMEQGLRQGIAQVEALPMPQNDPDAKFVAKLLASTEDTWCMLFQASGQEYPAPILVLFRGQTQTACESGQAAAVPFYCPGDQKVYIDLSFYQEMEDRFHALGDFSQAYVTANEVGHHIQNLQGISDKVQKARENARNKAESNQYSVQLELQADCYAGVRAMHADGDNRVLEADDVEEAMTAAPANGDDALQKQAQGYAVPDSFALGASQRLMNWFNRGLTMGNIKKYDTFSVTSLLASS